MNNDGHADVLFPASALGGQEPGLGVALNNGDGTFATPVAYVSGTGNTEPSVIVVADVNNDGNLDVLMDSVLQLGRGDGSFELYGIPTSFFVNNDTPRSYRTVDLNGDGQLDVVSLNTVSNAPGYCTSLNIGNGNFAPINCATTGGPSDTPDAFATGDFNGDGFADIAIDYGDETTNGLYVYLGKGDGTFASAKTGNLPFINAQQMEAADFNNDGKLDLIISFPNTNALQVMNGAGDGTFTKGTKYTSASNMSNVVIALGDFNGDGLTGFAVSEENKSAVDVFDATCTQ